MSEPFPTIDAPAPRMRFRILIGLALYFCIALWMAWYQYDFTTDGIVATMAEAIGSLIIPGLIAVAVARRKYIFPYYIGIAVSAAALLGAHQNGIYEAYDAHTLKQEMSAATPENYRNILAHSKSQIGQTINVMLDIAERRGQELQSLVMALDDQQLGDMLTSETLLGREKRALLRSLVQKKQEIAAHVLPQIAALYEQMEVDLRSATNGLSDHTRESAIRGFQETSTTNEKLVEQYVKTYAEAYKHLIAMCDILDENDGKFTIRQDGMVIFATNPPIAPYNKETTALRQEMSDIFELQKRFAAAQQANITRLANMTK